MVHAAPTGLLRGFLYQATTGAWPPSRAGGMPAVLSSARRPGRGRGRPPRWRRRTQARRRARADAGWRPRLARVAPSTPRLHRNALLRAPPQPRSLVLLCRRPLCGRPGSRPAAAPSRTPRTKIRRPAGACRTGGGRQQHGSLGPASSALAASSPGPRHVSALGGANGRPPAYPRPICNRTGMSKPPSAWKTRPPTVCRGHGSREIIAGPTSHGKTFD